ncbi:uncharacterized protein LOC130871293 [Chionomys nivalis]|uniref:uncharacterized protein LOC130871293 n=1 Tax=Chionomys nivalis TaxID=269649 RepID=UPI0025945302|nr:uncharacterized protein LOC130871293 [Chionomys nivalis]
MNKRGFDSNATGARAPPPLYTFLPRRLSVWQSREAAGRESESASPLLTLRAARAASAPGSPGEAKKLRWCSEGRGASGGGPSRYEATTAPGVEQDTVSLESPLPDTCVACQRLGCCLAKSYPARAIERALSKYTRGGALSSPRTCPAPVLEAAAHISPDQGPFRLREKNEAQEGRDLFAFPPGRQLGVCPETLSTFQASCACMFVCGCLLATPHHTGAGRKPEITFSVATFLLWP